MKPWIDQPHTKIYNVTELAYEQFHKNPDDATLALWFVHAPWMHMAWQWHVAGLIHLRDIEGQSKDPTFTVPGATHEFMVWALNPDMPLDFSIEKPAINPLQLLQPVSIVQQFKAENDAKALERIEHILEHVGKGEITLDTDGRRTLRYLLTGVWEKE